MLFLIALSEQCHKVDGILLVDRWIGLRGQSEERLRMTLNLFLAVDEARRALLA